MEEIICRQSNRVKFVIFVLYAHIDHGKSTLADRIIEKTGLLTDREMQAQVLDNMDLEKRKRNYYKISGCPYCISCKGRRGIYF